MSLPTVLALCAAALFGASTPASKRLLEHLGPFQLAGLLYLGAALGVLPAWRRGPSAPLDRRSRGLLAGVLLFGGGLAPVCLLLGLRQASAGSVSLWLVLEMAATAVLGAAFFRDHLGRSGWAGVLGAGAAAVLLCTGESAAPLGAGLWVGLACVAWGVDNQCSSLLDAVPPSRLVLWKGLAAGGVNLALGALVEPWKAGAGAVAAALGTGVLCYGLSLLLYVTASRQMGATRSQIAFAGAPFFGLGLSVAFLGEGVSAAQAGALGLFGVALGLLLLDRHSHVHAHAPVTHVHLHRHDDGHHGHAHDAPPRLGWHSHGHEHGAVEHAHPHWPDLHHRHRHEGGGASKG